MSKIPRHIAAVPNGNRRRSKDKGISLPESYVDGAMKAAEMVGWAREAGVKDITFYGLSCENMQNRSEVELEALQEGAVWFCDHVQNLDCNVHVFGKVHEFEGKKKYEALYRRLVELQKRQKNGHDFTVHVATNYSGRYELEELLEQTYSRGFALARQDPRQFLLSAGVPDVDLFLRTGGEYRISGLLPLQSQYAEIRVLDVYWGDLTKEMFQESLDWYARQQRNFGK
jgi:undecaprenyl diphosphate synthase